MDLDDEGRVQTKTIRPLSRAFTASCAIEAVPSWGKWMDLDDEGRVERKMYPSSDESLAASCASEIVIEFKID